MIDQHLRDACWIVQDATAINLSKGLGVAVDVADEVVHVLKCSCRVEL